MTFEEYVARQRAAQQQLESLQQRQAQLQREIATFRRTLQQQQTRAGANDVVASRVLTEGIQQAIRDTTAAINQRNAQLAQVNSQAQRQQVTVNFWNDQVNQARAREQRTRQRQEQQQQAQPTPSAPAPTPTPTTPATTEEEPIVGEGGEVVVTAVQPRDDHRVRLSAFSRTDNRLKEQIYGPRDKTTNILAPLWETDGLLFPYTPSIQVSQDTSWQVADLEHSNYDIMSFQKASSATISVTAKFTVQNQREGQYLLAAIHFLRTVSKAYFGEQDTESFRVEGQENAPNEDTPEEASEQVIERTRQDGRAGLPPPVLKFSGYGHYMFNDIRVVVKSHSWSYDETADLVKIDLPAGGWVHLPPMMTITMTLAIQQNTDRVRQYFNLDQFRTGELLRRSGGGWF